MRALVDLLRAIGIATSTFPAISTNQQKEKYGPVASGGAFAVMELGPNARRASLS